MADFIPAFLSKVQNQAVLHSNKILNDKIAQENRIANENEKIIIDEEIQELEGLYYNQNSISISGVDAEETRIDLREDIAEAEKENTEIRDKLAEGNLVADSLADPKVMEQKINEEVDFIFGALSDSTK